MNVLVVGGAGYIGSHVVAALLDADHTPIILDNLSRGHKDLVLQDVPFVEGDMSNSSLVENILVDKHIDAVMHFAAYAYVGESVHQPEEYYQNNVIHTKQLLDCMQRAHVKKLVFSSSCATYGTPVSIPMNESHPQKPINPYGRTKLIVEWMLQDYFRAYTISSVSLRYFNASGAHTRYNIGEDHTPETHLIPRCLMTLLHHFPQIEIFGNDYDTPDGTCIRDYIHVEDLASAHVLALEHLTNHIGADAYNLGIGTGFSVMEVVQTIKKITQRDLPFVIKPRREGDPSQLIADASLIQKAMSWKPRFTSLEPIIESAWQWHRVRHKK
jgi:UDP-glucose 4-epimerase